MYTLDTLVTIGLKANGVLDPRMEINKPYISLEDHSLSLGKFTAYAGEETKLLSYTITNNGQAKLGISGHDVALVLSNPSAKKSDFILTTRANGEIIDVRNGASTLGNGFNLEKYQNAPVSVTVTTPNTYSGTVKLILKSVSENDLEGSSGGGTHEVYFPSNAVAFKPIITTPAPVQASLKMTQISGITQPSSTNSGSLGVWKYQTFDDVSPYTSTFTISANNPGAKKVSIDLYMNGKFIQNFVNHTGDLNINGGNFGILPKNTSATIEFRPARDSELEAKYVKIVLTQVEYGDSTGDGKIAK